MLSRVDRNVGNKFNEDTLSPSNSTTGRNYTDYMLHTHMHRNDIKICYIHNEGHETSEGIRN